EAAPRELPRLARALLAEEPALAVLALLADVEGRDGTVVAHHARPHFAALALVIGQLDLAKLFRIGHCVHSCPPVDVASRGEPAPFFGQALLVALRAELVLPREIPVPRADRKRGCHGDVRQPEALERASHERLARGGR